MAADLIINEASAELQIVSNNPSWRPKSLVIVGCDGLFEVYARQPSLDHVFLGRLNEEISKEIESLKSARWTSVDRISAVETYELPLLVFDISLVRLYFRSELMLEWDAYCKETQLNKETGALGIEILQNYVNQIPIDTSISIFPDHRNINLFTVKTKQDGLLNEVARQPAGGLAGLHSVRKMEEFLKNLTLRQ